MARDLELTNLFLDLFSSAELRAWLGLGSPELKGLISGLPGEDTPRDRLVGALVPALERRGLIDQALFKSLLEARPKKRGPILAVAYAWGVQLDDDGGPDPAPPAGHPRPLEGGPFPGALWESRRKLPERGLRIAGRVEGDRVIWSASGWREDRPALTWTRGLSELDRALKAAGVSGRERWQKALDHPAPVGRALFEWLFGDRTRELCLLGFGSPERDVPTLGALRLRLTLPPELAGLPWRALRVRETLLLDCGWTIEEGPDRVPDRGLVLHNPPRMALLVIPSADDAELSSRWHARSLERRLSTLWPPEHRSDIVIAKTADEVRSALRRRPELVYVYARAELDEDGVALRLGRAAPHEDLWLDELLAGCGGAVVVLNLLGLEGPVALPLGAELPAAVVLGPADASPIEALTWAERWLDQCFGRARDPVLAAHHLGEAGRAGAGVRAWGAYEVGETHPRTGRDHVGKAAQTLDRVAARGDAWIRVHAFLGNSQRVLCLLGRGPPGEEVQRLGEILARHLRPQVEIHEWAWTPVGLQRRAEIRLDHTLRATLEGRLPAGADLSTRLAEVHRNATGRTTGRALLWLDCGTRRAPDPTEIRLWVEFAHTVLAPHCPEGLKIVWFLAAEARDMDELGELVEPPERGATDLAFEAPLAPIGVVAREELRLFLNDASHCSAATELSSPQRKDVLDALMHRTAGRWTKLCAEIDQAERLGWHELLLFAATLKKPSGGR